MTTVDRNMQRGEFCEWGLSTKWGVVLSKSRAHLRQWSCKQFESEALFAYYPRVEGDKVRGFFDHPHSSRLHTTPCREEPYPG